MRFADSVSVDPQPVLSSGTATASADEPFERVETRLFVDVDGE